MNALIPFAKSDAGASPGAAAFLEDLIDACVMECYFREHMAERDLLFHDTVAQAACLCPPEYLQAGMLALLSLNWDKAYNEFKAAGESPAVEGAGK